ncbi:MAG TPA: type ISP restriction/modification enzyme [Thermoanaerobaculia bacterium]|nr:type ISP restriction/modification enzyme [Thermoanaerobaculia bacterium]
MYATPEPVTGYVVRSVHLLLQSRFGRAAGLADPAVRLLDPAAGPLNFVLAACRRTVAAHREADGNIQALLSRHLLPHFHGVELLASEHARGLMAMRRFLESLGFAGRRERIAFRLADALAGPEATTFEPSEETTLPVLVGNPPWRGHSANQGPWITSLVRGYPLPDGREEEGYFRVDGQPLGERNPKWLSDDYVKFLRLAQWKIDLSGKGIVAFVVNHNGLDAPTFRGLRRSLMRTFEEIYALDLHGNQRKREKAPDGGSDENVFSSVAQGAAILLLVKRPGLRRRVLRADLFGPRPAKLRTLARGSVETTAWSEVQPCFPSYLFLAGDARIEEEYRRGMALPEIFPVHSAGVITGQDSLLAGLDRRVFEERFGLRENDRWRRCLTAYLARPFDVRHLLYAPELLARPRRAVMAHMWTGANLGLIVARQCKEEPGAMVTRWIAGHKALSAYDVNSLFPLHLYPQAGGFPNVAPELSRQLGEDYGAIPEASEILGYIYAVLYNPCYRKRYRELLRREFPRIQFSRDPNHFRRLAELGGELISLHLLEDDRLQQSSVRFLGDSGQPLGASRRKLCNYRESEGRVYVNEHGLRFEGIEPEVWAFRVGGYQVLSNWLQARAGHVLSSHQCREFRWTAEALRLTLRIQREIAGTDREMSG